jgi:uncharacterized protein (DUF1778 family)
MSKRRSSYSQSSGAAAVAVTERSSAVDTKGSINFRIGAKTRQLVLDADRYDAFRHTLDNPPAPGPKLRALLRRVPAWRR